MGHAVTLHHREIIWRMQREVGQADGAYWEERNGGDTTANGRRGGNCIGGGV